MRKRQRETDREREIRGRTYIPLICFLVTDREAGTGQKVGREDRARDDIKRI